MHRTEPTSLRPSQTQTCVKVCVGHVLVLLHTVILCYCLLHVCRLKVEELETERQKLEEQNNILEMRLERHHLQVRTSTFRLESRT